MELALRVQVPPTTAWTTDDEMKFLRGDQGYTGLLRCNMGRINANRAKFGMEPISKRQVLEHYKAQIMYRRWDPGVSPGELARFMDSVPLGRRPKARVVEG